MYKNILIPVDLADVEKGKATLDIAKRIGQEDCKITLLNVVEDIPSFVAVELPTGMVDKARDRAREMLDGSATTSSQAVEVDVRTGHANRRSRRPHRSGSSQPSACPRGVQ